MKIAMFMLFFVCNMFTVLIMRFAYESNYRYNNGMLIGVHIPGDHVNDDDVTRLMTRFKKSMKYFQNINAVLSIAICFLNFVNIIIFVIVYTIWILVFVFGIMYIQLSAHRKMYLLKKQNGWFVESQKQKVFIDTRACANADTTPHQLQIPHHHNCRRTTGTDSILFMERQSVFFYDYCICNMYCHSFSIRVCVPYLYEQTTESGIQP